MMIRLQNSSVNGLLNRQWYNTWAECRGQQARVGTNTGTFSVPNVLVDQWGENILTVTVTDVSGNSSTQQRRVIKQVADATESFKHDGNGNLTSWVNGSTNPARVEDVSPELPRHFVPIHIKGRLGFHRKGGDSPRSSWKWRGYPGCAMRKYPATLKGLHNSAGAAGMQAFQAWDGFGALVSRGSCRNPGLTCPTPSELRRNHRIAKAEVSGTTINRYLYLYDGWDIVALTTSSGVLYDSFTRGVALAGDIGGLIAVTRANQRYYLHNNHRGDITHVRMNNPSLSTHRYTAFGEIIGVSTSISRFRFSSKERDPSTGLYYYGYRFYAPDWQRWMSADPVREHGGNENLHCFVDARPTVLLDHLGNRSINPFDWGYGNWCGWRKSGQGGAPIDDLDAACMWHDKCLATWADAWKCPMCNMEFCAAVGAIDCSTSPNPRACSRAKREISLACNLVGAGLNNTMGWIWRLFQ